MAGTSGRSASAKSATVQTVKVDSDLEGLLLRIGQHQTSDGGMTAKEIAGALGICYNRALGLVRLAMDQGKIVVGRRIEQKIDGSKGYKPVYALKRDVA
jgi:hypothetical protein